jgi:glycosyltransferase involved in cell wall biosynthesis
MDLRADQIAIAVTVYSRSEFVFAAIQSALEQTIPVKVMVVEDCGPDPELQAKIVARFGDRIRYHRNPRNRGLFDNWNACLEYCDTPWLSILHDDDVLHPRFVETMLALNGAAPARSLYFGRAAIIEENGAIRPPPPVAWENGWREMDVAEFADVCTVLFPGQLFPVADVRACGGFRRHSYFTGDWDMWFKLALRGGLAQSAAEVALVRSHYGTDRGSSRVERMGWKWALDNVQRKRNRRLLKQARGLDLPFDRLKLLKASPIPTRYMLRYAWAFSPRWLAYNAWLYQQSTPPSRGYAVVQSAMRLTGPKGWLVLAGLWSGWRQRR